MAIRFPRITAAKRKEALEAAEREFARSDKKPPKDGKQKYVNLRVSEIKEWLELFQPREFSYGAYSVDRERVKELARRISIEGELDPVLIIRIGKRWVVIDGHHRLAAYRSIKRKEPIKCEWFAGTPTEAVDESLRRNKKDTLPIPDADKREEAYRRVLLGQGSKEQISKATGVSVRNVGYMRAAVRRYEEDPEFKKRVDRPLLNTSWGIMLLAGRDADYGERGLEEEAETLARNINRRLTNQLVRDPKVTAMALAKYDGTLPGQLMAVWGGEGWINRKSSEVQQRSEQETRRLIRAWREMADTAEAQMAEAAQAHPEKISVLHDAQGLVILDGDQEINF